MISTIPQIIISSWADRSKMTYREMKMRMMKKMGSRRDAQGRKGLKVKRSSYLIDS